jgi:molybdopterin-biosynthesis enzyme MoeA-like protein
MNYWGTAPGLLFEEGGKYVIVMPGVPKEMIGMMESFVINYLAQKSGGKVIKQRIFENNRDSRSISLRKVKRCG